MMATYNGANFLAGQLDSIENQTMQNWVLIVSDDGSSDQTLSILEHYQSRWGRGRLQIRSGPREGFCMNFLSMAADKNIKANYYAFSDQDDIWMPTKLQVAVELLSSTDSKPTLYCGKTTYFEGDLRVTGASPLFAYPASFRNALVQSIAGGNTMVFNPAVKRLIEQSGLLSLVSHDWWLYLLVSGAGGRVYYDPKSYLYYRQHSLAIIGGNTSLQARLKRALGLFNGKFRDWTDKNLAALNVVEDLLTTDSAVIKSEFIRLRNSKLLHRIRMIEVCGLYRQTKLGTLSLIAAAILKKI